MWIISKKLTKEKVHVQISKPEPDKARVERIVIKDFGGNISDYDFYHATQEEENRVRGPGDEYTLKWELGKVVSLDFSAHDAMYRLVIDTTETGKYLIADGIAEYEIRFTMKEADLSDVSDFRGLKVVPIQTPQGNTFIYVNFLNGVAIKKFSTVIGGMWVFPSYMGVFEDYILENAIEVGAVSTNIL